MATLTAQVAQAIAQLRTVATQGHQNVNCVMYAFEEFDLPHAVTVAVQCHPDYPELNMAIIAGDVAEFTESCGGVPCDWPSGFQLAMTEAERYAFIESNASAGWMED